MKRNNEWWVTPINNVDGIVSAICSENLTSVPGCEECELPKGKCFGTSMNSTTSLTLAVRAFVFFLFFFLFIFFFVCFGNGVDKKDERENSNRSDQLLGRAPPNWGKLHPNLFSKSFVGTVFTHSRVKQLIRPGDAYQHTHTIYEICSDGFCLELRVLVIQPDGGTDTFMSAIQERHPHDTHASFL